jgi:branched-chain amino acid transport system permease protein
MTSIATSGIKRRRNVGALSAKVLAYTLVALMAVWLVANFMKNPAIFTTVFFDGLRMGSLYALIALGYTMVYGIIQLINFAHGDLFMLGTIFAGTSIALIFSIAGQSVGEFGTDSAPSLGLGIAALVISLLLSMAFCGGLNVAIERLAYRRLRTAPKLAPLITAVGMSFVLQFVGLKWNGSGPQAWIPVMPRTKWEFGDLVIMHSTAIILAITIPLLIALTYLVNKTKQGKAMRATAQDQDAARLMGIDVNRTISFTFLLGGALAGAAGLMYQQMIATTNYNAGFRLGLIAFTAAVLGGIGNLSGAVLGGILIGLISELNAGLPYGLGQRWGQSVVFVILILLMVFKPEGLLGKPTTEKV